MTRLKLITTIAAFAVLALPSAASAADRDHDKMRDSWEKHFKLNTHKNDARKDRDRDGLTNLEEFRGDTNPRRRDSDHDGVRDNREGAGTIVSFDAATGALVIDLFGSDQDLTGTVDSGTKIECEDEGDDDDHATTGNTTGDTRGDGTPEDHAKESGSNSGPGGGDDAGNRQGDDDNGDRRHGDDDGVCTTADLTPGRVVKEAELNQGDDGPAGSFHEVEIVK